MKTGQVTTLHLLDTSPQAAAGVGGALWSQGKAVASTARPPPARHRVSVQAGHRTKLGQAALPVGYYYTPARPGPL